MSIDAKCELCGGAMPPGEEMFKYHGYSGPCPQPVGPNEQAWRDLQADGGLPEARTPVADVLAWMNEAQQDPTRYIRPESGVVRLKFTLPELGMIRRALELQTSLPENGEWVFVHETGEWRCHCGYGSTSWDRFVAHFQAPPRI